MKPSTSLTTICGYRIPYEHRPKDNPMGRFGACWNWMLGMAFSRRSAHFYLLVSTLMITKMKKEEDE